MPLANLLREPIRVSFANVEIVAMTPSPHEASDVESPIPPPALAPTAHPAVATLPWPQCRSAQGAFPAIHSSTFWEKHTFEL